MTSYDRPSLFDKSAQNDAKLVKMREKAMEAQVRKYINAEAKVEFERLLRREAEAAGINFDELTKPAVAPRTKIEIADDVLTYAVADFPMALFGGILKLLVLVVGIAFIYGMWKG